MPNKMAMVLTTTTWLLASFLAQPSHAATIKFEKPGFSFTFQYEDSWIPRVRSDGESVSFALAEGEILVALERLRGQKNLKDAESYAKILVKRLKDRVVFDEITATPSQIGGKTSVFIAGNGKLYDHPESYRVAIHVIKRDRKFYLVKFVGLYNKKLFQAYEKLIESVEFKERKKS